MRVRGEGEGEVRAAAARTAAIALPSIAPLVSSPPVAPPPDAPPLSAPPPIAPRRREMPADSTPSLACTSAWGMGQSGCEYGKARGRAGARIVGVSAPLHVEEELIVHRRQVQDHVVRRDGQECPSRHTTPFCKKCSARAGLEADHMHALEDLAGFRPRSWGGQPYSVVRGGGRWACLP